MFVLLWIRIFSFFITKVQTHIWIIEKLYSHAKRYIFTLSNYKSCFFFKTFQINDINFLWDIIYVQNLTITNRFYFSPSTNLALLFGQNKNHNETLNQPPRKCAPNSPNWSSASTVSSERRTASNFCFKISMALITN